MVIHSVHAVGLYVQTMINIIICGKTPCNNLFHITHSSRARMNVVLYSGNLNIVHIVYILLPLCFANSDNVNLML